MGRTATRNGLRQPPPYPSPAQRVAGAIAPQTAEGSAPRPFGRPQGQQTIEYITEEDDLDLFREVVEALDQREEKFANLPTGWRIEQNNNGFYRLRWQVKDDDGNPVTYQTKSGNTGYKRGSVYVNKSEVKRLKDK